MKQREGVHDIFERHREPIRLPEVTHFSAPKVTALPDFFPAHPEISGVLNDDAEEILTKSLKKLKSAKGSAPQSVRGYIDSIIDAVETFEHAPICVIDTCGTDRDKRKKVKSEVLILSGNNEKVKSMLDYQRIGSNLAGVISYFSAYITMAREVESRFSSPALTTITKLATAYESAFKEFFDDSTSIDQRINRAQQVGEAILDLVEKLARAIHAWKHSKVGKEYAAGQNLV